MASVEDMQYMAGHADGDASVAILLPSNSRRHLGLVYVRIDKSVKNPHMSQWFVEKFGGKLKAPRLLSQQRPNNSDTVTWQLEGNAAVEFCRIVGLHSHIKRREFQMASKFPADAVRRTKLTAVRLRKGHIEKHFESLTRAGEFVGRDPSAIYSALHRGGLCAGWSVERHQLFTRDQVKMLIQQMHMSLRLMKKLPGEAVEGPLSLPYVAGLFDAEGSLSIMGMNSFATSISQKDPAIRVALQRQFGGASSGWSWRAPQCGRPLLRLILPYCIEKRAQVELVLSMNGNGPEIKAKLNPLQRNKRKAVESNLSGS